MIVAHVERGSSTTRGRAATGGRVWMVTVHNGARRVIVVTNLTDDDAQHRADQLNALFAEEVN